MNRNEVIALDLPSLQSITLGHEAVEGKDSDFCSLTMRSMNDMIWKDRMQIFRVLHPLSIAITGEVAFSGRAQLFSRVVKWNTDYSFRYS